MGGTAVESWELGPTSPKEARWGTLGIIVVNGRILLLNMRLLTGYVLGLLLCCVLSVHGQNGKQVPFSGCYEVQTLTWSPPDDRIRLIPSRFELSVDRTQPGHDIFVIHNIPASPDNSTDSIVERSRFWIPKRNEVLLSFGNMGGFRGTLKPTNGDFVGKLKEWCDSRCEWKKRVGTIRVRKIDCPQ